MMTRDNKIKCDECGKFIPIQDLIDGVAEHRFALPDSEFSKETYESFCRDHKPLPREQQQ